MLQISPHAITISTPSPHAALRHWHHVALGLRPSVPVAPHALPVPPLLPSSGAVSVAHCHREHCSFLTPWPTRSLKLHFLLPQVFSQRGITQASGRAGSLTIAPCDTYQSFQNRGAASQFQQSSKQKIFPSHVLKGSVPLGRDPISIRDAEFLLISFSNTHPPPEKPHFSKIETCCGNVMETNSILMLYISCNNLTCITSRENLRHCCTGGCPNIKRVEALKKQSRRSSLLSQNYKILAVDLMGFRKKNPDLFCTMLINIWLMQTRVTREEICSDNFYLRSKQTWWHLMQNTTLLRLLQ